MSECTYSAQEKRKWGENWTLIGPAWGRFTGLRVLLLHTGEDQQKILDLHFDYGPKMAFIGATYMHFTR